MAIELRLTMFEDGYPDLTFAYQITDQQLADARASSADLGPFQSPEIVALMRYYVANAPMRRYLSLLLVAAVIVCGVFVVSSVRHEPIPTRGAAEKSFAMSVPHSKSVSITNLGNIMEGDALRIRHAIGGKVFPFLTGLEIGSEPVRKIQIAVIKAGIFSQNSLKLKGERGSLPEVLEIDHHAGFSICCFGSPFVSAYISSQLGLSAAPVLLEVSAQEPQRTARDKSLRNTNYNHPSSPPMHPLLGLQILFATLGFLGGCYGVIYAFSDAGVDRGATGILYLFLSISLMLGSGFYGAALLLP